MDAEAIRRAMKRKGGAITIWQAGDGFQANVRVGDGWTCTTADDPADALTEALRVADGGKPVTVVRAPAKVGLNVLTDQIFKDLLG